MDDVADYRGTECDVHLESSNEVDNSEAAEFETVVPGDGLGNQSLNALGFKLPAAKIRWFYDEKAMNAMPPLPGRQPNGASGGASDDPANQTQIVWAPFKGVDSLKLELEWRRQLTSVQKTAGRGTFGTDKNEVGPNVKFEKVIVCGGMYEVDLLSRICQPIYHAGDDILVRRGYWFYQQSKQPMKESLAAAVEAEHVTRWSETTDDYNLNSMATQFSDNPLEDIAPDAASDIFHSEQSESSSDPAALTKAPSKNRNVVVHRVVLRGMQLEWTDEQNCWISSDTSNMRALTGLVYRMAKKHVKIERGYHEPAQPYDGYQPIRHVVFMVHGVGQFRDSRKIIRNTKFFEAHIRRMLTQRCNKDKIDGRVVFMPIEWRSKLLLDNGLLNAATPDKIRRTRETINDTVMDLFYYHSSVYKKEILDHAEHSFKNVTDKFMQRHPDYSGSFSIFAHSMGSLISYDLLHGWDQSMWARNAFPETTEFGKNVVEEIGKRKRVSRIAVPIKYYFSVASPLGVIRVMDGKQPVEGKDAKPTILFPENLVERHINLFHPSDPVAYRIEPLVHRAYEAVAPVKVHSEKAVRKQPYPQMEIQLLQSHQTPKKPSPSNSQDDTRKSIAAVSTESSQPSVEQSTPPRQSGGYRESVRSFVSFSRWRGSSPKSATTDAVPSSSTLAAPTLEKRSASMSPTSHSANKEQESESSSTQCPDEKSQNCQVVVDPVGHAETGVTRKRSGEELVENSAPPEQTVARDDPGSSSESNSSAKAFIPDLPTGRIDHELQDSSWRFSSNLATLTSHSSYWHNADVALFLLEVLFPGCSTN